MSEDGGRLAGLSERHGSRVDRILRFGGSAIVATVCSQTTFVILYGLLDASPAMSSVVAWLAGAIPNYLLNRSWTWGRRGRPSVRRELVPYIAIVLGTLCLAIVATAAGDAALDGTSVSHTVQTLLVTAIYFAVYVVMFGFRFLLFDRLFATPAEGASAPDGMRRDL